MPTITADDFKNNTNDIQTKMMVIVMDRMQESPLTPYHNLTLTKRKRFDVKLNEFLRELIAKGEEGKETLDTIFRDIVKTNVFTDEFKAEKYFIANEPL